MTTHDEIKRIHIEQGRKYDVHRAPSFQKSINETFSYLAEKYDMDYARKWHGNITKFIDRLENPRNLGTIDPHYSQVYSHLKVPGTETQAFMHVEEGHIFLVWSGMDTWPWPEIMRQAEPEIEKNIAAIRENLAISAPAHRYDAGAALERIEADQKHKPQSPDRGDPSDRSDRD